MSIAVGIDLGTFRSAIAVYLNEEITVIPQENGEDFIPTVVSSTSSGILVGRHAEEQSIENPSNTIFGVKRIIGRRFNDPCLQRFIETVSYKIKNVDGNPKISVKYRGEDRLYDPEFVAAMVLKKLKEKTEIILGHKVTKAVITVPSFFNDSQRQATIDAGTLAGLNVLQILNEPTAAAIAYGFDRIPEKERNILIYNFGCGMFDVSVLKIKQGMNFETQATLGDTSLSGDDIDNALVNYCADLFLKENNKDIKGNSQAIRRLKIACSHAKHVLSKKDETSITVDSLMDGIGLDIKISRSKFENLCAEIFERTIELLHQVIKNSGIDKKDIDDVVLTGGPSEIPKVRQLVSDYFKGKSLSKFFKSSHAVAYGAAIQAAFLSGYKDRKIMNLLCTDVTPLSVGIETSGGIMEVVIKKDTPIPVKRLYPITTHTNEPEVAIRIFEGERALTSGNCLLGVLKLEGLSPLPREDLEIRMAFEIDSNGILDVSVDETSDMKFHSMCVNLDKSRLSSDEISRMIRDVEESEKEDECENERTRRRISLENYINSLYRAAFTNAGDKLDSRDKLEIHKIYNEVRDWLEANPLASAETLVEKRNMIIKRLQPYASRLNLSAIKRDQEVKDHSVKQHLSEGKPSKQRLSQGKPSKQRLSQGKPSKG